MRDFIHNEGWFNLLPNLYKRFRHFTASSDSVAAIHAGFIRPKRIAIAEAA